MSECAFPNCTRHAEKNGYCIGHRIYAKTPEPAAEPYRMPKVSEKQKVIDRKVGKIVKEKKKKSDMCQIKSPVCIGGPVHSHHVKGRIGPNATDPDEIVLACDPCNGFVVTNVEWAEQNGFVKSKHAPNYNRNKIKNS